MSSRTSSTSPKPTGIPLFFSMKDGVRGPRQIISSRLFRGISISSGVLANKAAYYKALENSENRYNDITFIIIFYLETILDTLYKSLKGFGFNERHMDMSSRQRRAVEFLRKSSGNLLTVESYCRRFAVNEVIAKRELQELVDNEVIMVKLGEDFRLEFYSEKRAL